MVYSLNLVIDGKNIIYFILIIINVNVTQHKIDENVLF